MIFPVLVSSLGLLLLQSASALPAFFRGQFVYNGLPLEKQLMTTEDPYAKTLVQKVDHFDRSNQNTFSQRYFINDTFWQGPESNAPVFLCVGGEGKWILQALSWSICLLFCVLDQIKTNSEGEMMMDTDVLHCLFLDWRQVLRSPTWF